MKKGSKEDLFARFGQAQIEQLMYEADAELSATCIHCGKATRELGLWIPSASVTASLPITPPPGETMFIPYRACGACAEASVMQIEQLIIDQFMGDNPPQEVTPPITRHPNEVLH